MCLCTCCFRDFWNHTVELLYPYNYTESCNINFHIIHEYYIFKLLYFFNVVLPDVFFTKVINMYIFCNFTLIVLPECLKAWKYVNCENINLFNTCSFLIV